MSATPSALRDNQSQPTPTQRTTCYECDANCVFRVERDASGAIRRLQGPPCLRGTGQLGRQNHPDRLLYPLKQTGQRGHGTFERIDWDEALDTIAERLKDLRQRYGPESVGFFAGYTKEARPFLQRLAHTFGSPNYLTESGCCFSATLVAEKLTYGYRLKSSSLLEQPQTRTLIVWSTNPPHSVMPYERHHILDQRAGRTLVVVDPRRSETAEAADLHLQIRPGTDGALALGMHHVIFANGWADEDLLREWATGVEAFRAYVQAFTPERTAAICGIPTAQLEEAARLYATQGPAQLVLSPTATVQHSNGFQNHRAIILLAATTGNVDNQGGNRFFLDKYTPTPIDRFQERIEALPPRIGDDRFPIWTRYWPAAQSMLMNDCMQGEGSTRLRGLVAMGINSTMFPNSRRFVEGLNQLEFSVCTDFFHNEATRHADLVLPAATALERPTLIAYPGCQFKGEVRYREAVLPPRGEARSDAQIFLDLGCRLEDPATFWHGNLQAAIDVQASGLPESIRDAAFNDPEGATVWTEMLAELEDADRLYTVKGFPTWSGRIEFDSEELRSAGYDGLPIYQEPAESPVSRPDLAERYPLVLTSGGRSKAYTHSQQHNVPHIAATDPVPRAQLHPTDAAARGIQTGDFVRVGTERGAVRFIAELTDRLQPGVVHCFHGWAEANVNELTDDRALDPISGFPPFKSALCNVEKV